MEGSNYWGYGYNTQHSYPRSRLITWRRRGVKFGRNKKKTRTTKMRTKVRNKKLILIPENSKYRPDWDRNEVVNRIIIKCSKLAQKKCKTRHNWTGKEIYWELWKRLKFDHDNKLYMQKQESLLENETHSIFEIPKDQLFLARRPNLVLIKNKDKYIKWKIKNWLSNGFYCTREPY